MAYQVFLKGGNVADVDCTMTCTLSDHHVFYNNPEALKSLNKDNFDADFDCICAYFHITEVQGIVKK